MKYLLTIITLYLLLSISQAWSLPTCPGSPQTEGSGSNYWDNCIGTYTWDNGDKYIGEWKDDKKYGQGTLTWGKGKWEGDKYVGEFKDDIRTGQGTYTWADAQKYVGEYKDGKMHGQGTYTWPDGSKYVGDWKDDKKHGQGTFTFADGKVWQGQWKNDDWVSGEYYTADEYETKLKAERRIKLKEEFKAKLKAEREVKLKAAKELKKQKEDALVKQRTLELENELKQKKLILKAAGEYNPSSQVSSLPPCAGSNWNNCYGTYTFADGRKYVGEFKDGTLNGQGTYTHADGSKYVGEFKDGKFPDQGIWTYNGVECLAKIKKGGSTPVCIK